MGSVPASGTHVCTMIYVSNKVTCVPLAGYILLMTPQLEVLNILAMQTLMTTDQQN